MGWHKSHKTRISMSSYYDIICDTCGATDTFELSETVSVQAAVLREVFGKEAMYKLLYSGHDPAARKWLEFGAIIGQITYKPGWYFRVGIEGERMWVQIGVTAEADISFDPIEGKKNPWRGAKHYLSQHMCRQEIVSTVHHAIERAELHEVNEWFRYKKRAIYNPHLDPDKLADFAAKWDNFNVRENTMTMEEN
jgi:hypothetical protein